VKNLKEDLKDFFEQIKKSIFRHGKPTYNSNRGMAIIGNVFLHIHPKKLPRFATKYSYTWGMGGIAFLLFLIEVVTGILLMFYYHPTTQNAYMDMKSLQFDVPLGIFIRNMHRWTAHLMVIVVWLHMFRVFMTGSYKKPREFNWGIGVILLVLTLLMSFTGYLLPWDQLSIWAITVGTNMAASIPFIGYEGPFSSLLGVTINNDIRFLLLGGTSINESTLLRFYVLHCVAIPFIMCFILAIHFWRIRKDGGISTPKNLRQKEKHTGDLLKK